MPTTSFSIRPFLSLNFVNLFACSGEMLCRGKYVYKYQSSDIIIIRRDKNVSEITVGHSSSVHRMQWKPQAKSKK